MNYWHNIIHNLQKGLLLNIITPSHNITQNKSANKDFGNVAMFKHFGNTDKSKLHSQGN